MCSCSTKQDVLFLYGMGAGLEGVGGVPQEFGGDALLYYGFKQQSALRPRNRRFHIQRLSRFLLQVSALIKYLSLTLPDRPPWPAHLCVPILPSHEKLQNTSKHQPEDSVVLLQFRFDSQNQISPAVCVRHLPDKVWRLPPVDGIPGSG